MEKFIFYYNNIYMNFAYTLQILAFKQVSLQGVRKQYSKFTGDEQMLILKNLITHIENDYIKEVNITYEKHKDRRYHSHGTIFNSSISEMSTIQESVCRIVGVKTQKQFNEIFLFVPIYSMGGWDTYIKKDIPLEFDIDEEADILLQLPYNEVFNKI